MILAFPSQTVFRRALIDGLFPTTVVSSALKAQIEPEGMLRLEVLKKDFSRKELAHLEAHGVALEAKFGSGETILFPALWMIFSLEPQTGPIVYSATAPVLFELDDAHEAKLISEMLRLGNDRIAHYPQRTEQGTLLYRAISPPYFTFLRTLETNEGICRAYLEAAPRCWVRAGFHFSIANSVAIPADKLLLAGPPREYRILPSVPFVDIYERVRFEVPNSPEAVAIEAPSTKWKVPLRLVAGDSQESTRLWIFRNKSREKFERWLHGEGEKQIAQFLFAVGKEQGEEVIILQARAAKNDPPLLPDLGAEEYLPYWKLPNLFLPLGKRLQPILRRDRVRELLAPSSEEIVWLRAWDNGQFQPESLSEKAFQPLEDWVEYVMSRERVALSDWMHSFTFAFEEFQCPEDEEYKPSLPKEPQASDTDANQRVSKPRPKPSAEAKETAKTFPVEIPRPQEAPEELRLQREALEKEFRSLTVPIESQERQELWPRLAAVNASLGELAEASLCWVNAAWRTEEFPRDWLRDWSRAEIRPNASKNADPFADLPTTPTSSDVRVLAARVLNALGDPKLLGPMKPRLPQLMTWFEEHDRLLSLRLTWLLWRAMLRAGNADVLRLARVRDRLLERLRIGGLNIERDLPAFLRYGGEREGDRLRTVRLRLEKLRETILNWHGKSAELNRPYVDLIFAYGMARLGLESTARERVDRAGQYLQNREIPAKPKSVRDEAAAFLWKAYAYRIEQALGNQPNNALFPASFANDLEDIIKRTSKLPQPASLTAYTIERFLEKSWILSPNGSPDPYRAYKTHKIAIRTELDALSDIKDRDRLTMQIGKLFADASRERNSLFFRIMVVADSLHYAPRAGETFTLELLRQVPGLIDESLKTPPPTDSAMQTLAREKEVLLQQQALFLAGHFNQPNLAKELFRRLTEYVKRQHGRTLAEVTAKLARGAVRGLRRLGLRGEVEKFLNQVYEQLVPGGDLAKTKARVGRDWPIVLSALLPLAEAWQALDARPRAEPIMAEARLYLFHSNKYPAGTAMEYANVAIAYLAALGESQPAEILTATDEFFEKLAELPNTLSTSAFYSRFHLSITDETVRMLVGDDRAIAPEVRRWLEDDEYLVRQRIHRDMQAMLGT